MNKQQLASKIWESANKMRSKIEANEYKVPVKYDKLLREFIVSGGFDLKMPKES